MVADILTLAPVARGGARGDTVRDPHPPCQSPDRAALPDLLHRARACPARRSDARSGGVRTGRWTNGLELGRVELNHTRAQLGLPPLAHVHGGTSRELALVATFPQLEYPRGVARAHATSWDR